ncbi:MAG: hypothetical protein PVG06_14825 [Desulfobacterales bacterium]|jgi:hypothetical protein
MSNQALFIGWKRPARGREEQAMKLWGKSIEYYGKLQAEGRIESFEPVILQAHGGDLNGFFLIRGDAKNLNEIRREDDFIDILIEAGYCIDGFGIITGFIGEELENVFNKWGKLVTG